MNLPTKKCVHLWQIYDCKLQITYAANAVEGTSRKSEIVSLL